MENKSKIGKELKQFLKGLKNNLERTAIDIQDAIEGKGDDYLTKFGLLLYMIDGDNVQEIALSNKGRELSQGELVEVLSLAVYDPAIYSGMSEAISNAIDKIIANKAN